MHQDRSTQAERLGPSRVHILIIARLSINLFIYSLVTSLLFIRALFPYQYAQIDSGVFIINLSTGNWLSNHPGFQSFAPLEVVCQFDGYSQEKALCPGEAWALIDKLVRAPPVFEGVKGSSPALGK